jgi:hypothetical protein
MSRHLPADKVWVVDQAVSRMIHREAGGRTIDVAEAKVIEADPELHRRRVEEENERRYVALTRTDQAGLRTIIASVQSGDAAAFDALVTRTAEILALSHPDHTRDELRSIAIGWVAHPAELLKLLLEHLEPVAGEPAAEEPYLNRAIAFPADLLATLRSVDLSRLRTSCTLYVHIDQAALTDPAGVRSNAVARVEGIGPIGLSQLQSLVGRTNLVVKPVLDLSDRIRTTAYEHPESLKERIHLITGGDYWPYASSVSRKVDSDHPTPFVPLDEGGPPGQTGTHNSGPLGRRHHRWKTHAPYRARQSGQGRYVVTTPHGLAFLRDHRGTRPIDPDQARQIIDAGPLVDVYFPPDPVRLELAF